MKNLANCRSLIKIGIIALVVALGTSLKPDVFAQGNSGNNSITANIEQHDTDIKADISTHDTEVKNILNNTINPSILTHEGNMTAEHDDLTAEHGSLTDDHVILEGKLDQVLTGVENGGCQDCPNAWNKVISDVNDRFVLVMNDEAVLDKETCLVWEKSPDIVSTVPWNTALQVCYGKEVGGRKGWHLPTVEQLASLVDKTNPGTLPDGHPFTSPPTGAGEFVWSATSVPNTFGTGSTVCMGILYSDGSTGTQLKANSHRVWCVRGGQNYNGGF